jgi:phospholipid/cholesterol/gamma-HCH transport system permease protein
VQKQAISHSNSPEKYHTSYSNNGELELELTGDWIIGEKLPPLEDIKENLHQYPNLTRVNIKTENLGRWDSRLVSLILRLSKHLQQSNIQLHTKSLPVGIQSLLSLATAVPERTGARKILQQQSFLENIGNKIIDTSKEGHKILSFIGKVWLSLPRLLQGKARFRMQDFWSIVQECGPNALPIVTLISLLIGLILAFIGAIQLRLFGADIYVANLVAIGMTREMGAMMTAIILAGRTGAAFAAKLGTMQVNEEIDAFKTMGIATMDFLVVPRVLALVFMMPLLTIYANMIGMLGGLFVGVTMLNISFFEYYQQTISSITLIDYSTGVFKSVLFGLLIAVIGCMSGMHCGRSSSAVGDAATSAVVRINVSIVVTDAIFTILFESLGI